MKVQHNLLTPEVKYLGLNQAIGDPAFFHRCEITDYQIHGRPDFYRKRIKTVLSHYLSACIIFKPELKLMTTSDHIWGVDLGGTKIEAAVLASANPRDVLARERIDTEAHKGYEHSIGQIRKLIDHVASKVGSYPSKLGIGTPGSIDPESGLLKNSNSVNLNHKPLQKDLIDILRIPVHIANDANCFALAEAKMGVVPDIVPEAKVVFGVIMGTGVGGGIIVDGNPINGSHGIGGEWGHNFLDESGGRCYCGKTGCVETVISGTGLQKFYASRAGEQKKLKDILTAAGTGTDPDADATRERLIEMFGRAISVIINILDPDAIVLGGGVGNADILYTEGRKRAMKYVFNPTCHTPFLRPKLGDSAGVFGAAMLVA
jgi:predicted NBD/HSP70 family sugar kinase